MKLFLTIASLLLVTPAFAGTTCQQIGRFTYCHGSDGSSYTGQSIGRFEYWNGTIRDENGTTTRFNQTCHRIGQFTNCN